MNLNPYCNPLKLNFQILAREQFLHFCKTKYMNYLDYKTFLHKDFLKFLESRGIEIRLLESFYSKPYYTQPIHKDDPSGGNDMVKINIVFGGKDSYMSWYELKDPTVSPAEFKTLIDTSYTSYYPNQLDLVYTTSITSPCLVQVGVPHRIVNFEEERICISLVLVDEDDKRITMQQALEIFSDCLI